MDEDYAAGLRGEMAPPPTDSGHSQHLLGLERRAEMQAAHRQRLDRVYWSARHLGEVMVVHGFWRMLQVFLALAVVLPLGFGIAIALIAALLGGDVAHAFEVAWGLALFLWLAYGVLVFSTYALVRYFRWFLLAGGILVAILIVREKM